MKPRLEGYYIQRRSKMLGAKRVPISLRDDWTDCIGPRDKSWLGWMQDEIKLRRKIEKARGARALGRGFEFRIVKRMCQDFVVTVR